jgi:hypothetical protein
MKMLLRPLLCCMLLLTASGLFSQKLKAEDNSQNAGKVEWTKRQVDAGKVPFGVPVTGEFEVKNISTENLIILDVRSGCHCTSVEWAREPIPPGQTGVITAIYDAQKEGDFYRIITVITNFDPAQSVPMALVGKVEKPATVKN